MLNSASAQQVNSEKMYEYYGEEEIEGDYDVENDEDQE